MDVEAVLLSKGSVALLTLVGFLPTVQSLMNLEVVLDREPLTARATHPRPLTRMRAQVPRQPLVAVEELWTLGTLELLVLDVHILLVLHEDPAKRERLPTKLTHMWAGPGLVTVLPSDVDFEVEAVVCGVRAVFADEPFSLHASPVGLHVHVEGGAISERCSAGMAKVFPPALEEGDCLPVGQPHPVRTESFTGDLSPFVNTQVVGQLQTARDDAVALETSVLYALVVLQWL